jgi:membrane carboxypeptidase/penicillin-binding protein
VDSYTVRSSINPKLQRAAEGALQEGLAKFELGTGRTQFRGPEMNLSEAIQRIDADQKTRAIRRDRVVKAVWQIALENAALPLYDVQWTRAIVLDRDRGLRIGLTDGRILPLSTAGADRSKLNLYDVIYVRVVEGKGKNDARAELRVRPHTQGAAVVLENKSGRILAMAGGFSYVLSQLNRATQSIRQPGSSIKPLVYLTALHAGLQPNTLVLDAPITLPPISNPNARHEYWTPKNYEGGASGVMTMRRALERSRNMVTARLLAGAIDPQPKTSLEKICALALEAKIYPECMMRYPFVLGAQAVRPIDLAGFYTAIASEGAFVQPHAIDSIWLRDKIVYKHNDTPTWLAGGDRVAFFQLRTMLEGVVARGTARGAMGHLATFVAGKTGTTDNENDAWFASFTSDVTVVVWIGYDNAGGQQTLGRGGTGGHVAAPIAEPIIQAAWQYVAPKAPLPPPSPEVARVLRIEKEGGRDGITEYLRTDARGKVIDTRNALVGGGRHHLADRQTRGRSRDDDQTGSFEPRAARYPRASAFPAARDIQRVQ